jgi:glycosyltransferase involved in cell wall biosynthesis
MSSPRVSVFTPSHRPTFLDDCYTSLTKQTYSEWEWVIVLNGGNKWTPPVADERVVIVDGNKLKGVGALKRHACEVARGEILVELDHDDMLTSDALELVVAAFDNNPDCGFVYSDCAHITAAGERNDHRYNAAMGWEYEEAEIDGATYLVTKSFDAFPNAVSYIWFAPNHVRAFRSDAYEAVGGYDPALDILDDQDLMCRLYQHSDFYHIKKCLYLQRFHEANTQHDAPTNARIQQMTVQLYDKYIEANALVWARRNNLLALDLGAAYRKRAGYLGVDIQDVPSVDIVADLREGLDMPDSSVGVIRAVDFLEHIPDKIGIINEIYRLLAHGGMLLSNTPSTDGRGAFQDPTHVAFYNENSFWYYTRDNYRNFVPEIQCKFIESRLITFFPDKWHEENYVSYVNANLVAVKDGSRIPGRQG